MRLFWNPLGRRFSPGTLVCSEKGRDVINESQEAHAILPGKSERIMPRGVLDLLYIPLPLPRELNSLRVRQEKKSQEPQKFRDRKNYQDFQAALHEKAATLRTSEVVGASATKWESQQSFTGAGAWNRGPWSQGAEGSRTVTVWSDYKTCLSSGQTPR